MTRKPRRPEATPIERGSGNVYAYLGCLDADPILAKARIVARIGQILRERNLTQAAAARVLGINQPKVSALLRGHFQGYSQERLIALLNRLGCDVEIVVRLGRRKNAAGQVSVTFARQRHAMRFQRITSDPARMGGMPCIRGFRIPVATVVELLADGMSEADILAAYPDLTGEDVREALRYA